VRCPKKVEDKNSTKITYKAPSLELVPTRLQIWSELSMRTGSHSLGFQRFLERRWFEQFDDQLHRKSKQQFKVETLIIHTPLGTPVEK
jgi:hypothetical protein